MRTTPFTSIDDVRVRLAEAGYIASNAVATTVYLASELGKPLLVEGPAGVGKTELARAVAAHYGGPRRGLGRGAYGHLQRRVPARPATPHGDPERERDRTSH